MGDTAELSDSQTTESTTSGDSTAKIEGGLQAALKAERAARQAAEARASELAAAQEAAERKAAEKRGEFEQLYQQSTAELEAARARVAEFEARETARLKRVKAANATRLEQLPDPVRTLAPDYSDPDAMSAWLEKAMTTAGTQMAAGGMTRGKTTEPEIPQLCREQAAAAGEDPKWWHEHVWNKLKVAKPTT